MERLLQMLNGLGKGTDSASVVETVKRDAEEFAQGSDPFDDLTMLMIRRQGA